MATLLCEWMISVNPSVLLTWDMYIVTKNLPSSITHGDHVVWYDMSDITAAFCFFLPHYTSLSAIADGMVTIPSLCTSYHSMADYNCYKDGISA